MSATYLPCSSAEAGLCNSNRCCCTVVCRQPGAIVVQAGTSSEFIASEEVEGGSPTSEHSASIQLSGSHAARMQRPKRGMVRWVLRALNRKQQEPTASAGDMCVSGGSFESLSNLEQQSSVLQPATTQQCTTCAKVPQLSCLGRTTQHQQHVDSQLVHTASICPYHHHRQQLTTCQVERHGGIAGAVSSSTRAHSGHRTCAGEGLLRRCVKAVLRPVVHVVCRAAQMVADSAGPRGPGNNDNSIAERIGNVLTSLPFIAVGLHGLRNRRCPKGRHFALSFLILGAVASGYHGADRASWLRPVMRKLDYYSICYTSAVLRSAAHIRLPNSLKVVSMLVAPFKPTLVTGLNLVLVEGKFLRSALAHTHLRSTFKAHVGSAAVGMVCFAYEDVATSWGWPPVLHSLWHCLSAFAMGAVHGLLEHLELAVLVEGLQLEAS